MKCQNCGSEISMDTKVCPYCDSVIAQSSADDQPRVAANESTAHANPTGRSLSSVPPVVEYRKGFVYLALIPIILLFVICLKSLDGSMGDVSSQLQGEEDEEKISVVRDGSPELIPHITYGEAYKNFFADPTWRYFVANDEDESEVVEFVGGCTYEEEPAEVYIQFLFDKEDDSGFSFYYARIKMEDETIQADNSTIIELIYKPFAEYAEEVLEEPLSDEIRQQFEEEYKNALYADYIGENGVSSNTSGTSDTSDTYDEEYEEEDTYDDETDEEYDGEEEYDEYSNDEEELEEEFIFEDSDSRYLKVSEIKALDKETIRLAKNEIYARHGRMFDDRELQEYFDGMSWYEGTIEPEDFDEHVFNQYEKKNVKKLASFEK